MLTAETIFVQQMACARIPTAYGEFDLCLYTNNGDEKEHLALIMGDVAGRDNVLVRIHSECFTGDVIGSQRCDCGEQLDRAIRLIARSGEGIIVYLRQEGRGIGLLDKLKAYNLQDEGYDTVEANLELGHEADERDYTIAARILEDLDVASVRLITNNPAKIRSLEALSISVSDRVPLHPSVNSENADYLRTKATRMNHLLDIDALTQRSRPADGSTVDGANGRAARQNPHRHRIATLLAPAAAHRRRLGRPFVTVSYAQSLDGSIAAVQGTPIAISGPEAYTLTHELRAAHEAILVGIGTALADDPRLTVRRVSGSDPQPIIVDSRLRLPTDARVLQSPPYPWVMTTTAADTDRGRALEAAGARVIRLPADADGRVDLAAMLQRLGDLGIDSVMVEGGAGIITSMLTLRLADYLIVTIAPRMLGGFRALQNGTQPLHHQLPRLQHVTAEQLGDDIVLWGEPAWETV